MRIEVPTAVFVRDILPVEEDMAWNFLAPRRPSRREYDVMDILRFPSCPVRFLNDSCSEKRRNSPTNVTCCKKQKKEKEPKEQLKDTTDTTTIDASTRFAVHVPIGDVHPDDVKVRVEDRVVRVHARKRCTNHRGYFVKEIIQKFQVPDGVEEKSLKSSLADGMLTIEAPKVLSLEETANRQQRIDNRGQGTASTMEHTENDVVEKTPEIPVIDISIETNKPQKEIDITDNEVSNETATSKRGTSTLPEDNPLSPLPITPSKKTSDEQSCQDIVESTDDENAARKKEEMIEDWVTAVKLPEFKPEEVSVKVADNVVLVQARKEQEDEHGRFFTEMNRRFTIPENVNADQISSRLYEDGILKIIGPRIQLQDSQTH